MKRTALITGATSGIGEAIAEKLASKSYNLILTGRRAEKLQSFSDSLIKKYGIEILSLVFDVRNKAEVDANLKNLPAKWQSIDVLVNNAGLAVGLNPLHEGVIDDWERMIDTNVKGLLYVSRAISPLMVKNGKGHIVNIGSIAGKEAYTNGNVYCGTKHAVDAISKGMRMDLVSHGIKVTQICPGAVETEFSKVRFKGDTERAASVYKGFQPLKAEDIADAVMYCVELPSHVNINDMLIMPTAQASSTVFHKIGL